MTNTQWKYQERNYCDRKLPSTSNASQAACNNRMAINDTFQ